MPALPNSILDDTKKLLGISPDDQSFDTDVMIHINSTFSILHQLGVGPADGFEITSKNQLWADFLGTNKLVNNAKNLGVSPDSTVVRPSDERWGPRSQERTAPRAPVAHQRCRGQGNCQRLSDRSRLGAADRKTSSISISRIILASLRRWFRPTSRWCRPQTGTSSTRSAVSRPFRSGSTNCILWKQKRRRTQSTFNFRRPLWA